MSPLISIIVTTYKRPLLLERCLSSISAATKERYEIIVVDDSAIGEGFAAASLHSAAYIKKGPNSKRGPGASRNLGLKNSRGRMVAFIDDDDYFVPEGLDALLKNIGNDAFSYGNYNQLSGTTISNFDLSEVKFRNLLVTNSIPVGAYIFSRSAIRYEFDEHLRSHEDWDFLLKNLENNSIKHVKSIIVTIDASERFNASRTAKARQEFWLDYLAIYARYPDLDLAESRAARLRYLGFIIPPQALAIPSEIPEIN